MNDSEYRAALTEISETCHRLHSLIHVSLEAIKNSDTGMDDRWTDLYAMMRLVGVTVDLSNSAAKRG